MEKVISVETMRESDAYTIKNYTDSKKLMYNAGKAVFESIEEYKPTAIVCGSGNNAGDGYVLALLLKEKGIRCKIFLIKEKFSSDGAYYFEKCIKSGISYEVCDENTDFSEYDIIVDCIFGTGFKGEITGISAEIIDKINNSGKQVISVDINSGLNGDNGMTKLCVKSDLTVSLGYYKTGHFLNMAKDFIGKLKNCDIGIKLIGKNFNLLSEDDFKTILTERDNFSNKGSYGYAGIIGGCKEYSGAIKLANMSLSALKCGCGVSKLIIPKALYNSVSPYILESTLSLVDDNDGHMRFNCKQLESAVKNLRSLAIGMGWGNGEDNYKILSYILENYELPIIIDADGLNVLAKSDLNILKNTRCKVILTPHIKEFSRLCKKSVDEIFENPLDLALDFAKEYKVILLLKGTTTIITDGNTVYLCNKGTPGMATAGSGDVLSGILAGLAAYSSDDLLLTTACASFINGLSGELAAKTKGDICMTSSDTVANIPGAIACLR